MNGLTAYRDLKIDAELLEIRANDLEAEYKTLYECCFMPGRKPMMQVDKALDRLDEIKAQHLLLQHLCTLKRDALRQMEAVMQQSVNIRIAHLRDIEGRSLSEIAETLGLSLSATKQRSAKIPRVAEEVNG
ncbi:sigma-70-like protein [Paenibacillus cellulosilyticus]|uniref:Sigma-70-like protein n=1 Tax=Paenibacillus cellulosilyticus TaxID=375489 RepID=A0A2V2YN16_9BACL|nr:sigma factor-like helix-turn-helix DNA-binding protein [Paenibacillus cellulosilyticus]PWV90243.1 sigma-70-like protein [Paenibacillus cellulosilyticus]QKS43401.1 hypothetical protein HUB94_02450 [Paenibacillus cellulosilyticus]